jgi:hypothetical protein
MAILTPVSGKRVACHAQLQLPSDFIAGGVLTMAYEGSALTSMAMIKERIMLSGGVITSIAMSGATFAQFESYKPSNDDVFKTTAESEDASRIATMHAVFCYGWWDNPRSTTDGYWLCKNR